MINAVAQVFEDYPATVRQRLLALRELILQTAATTAGVGKLEETLKWGEPAYVTAESKGGSTIRQITEETGTTIGQEKFSHALRDLLQLPDHAGRDFQNPVPR